MAFNPSAINTSMPPPNFPTVPMQFPSRQAISCPTPQISQQHMFSTGMHVPLPNPSPSPFNAVPSNHLPSPSPHISLGFVHNPMQTSSPMWNNNAFNSPMVNNQNHNFSSAPPVLPYSQANHVTGSFQAPPPLPNNQLQSSGWGNSSNHPPNNHIGLLAIAPMSSGNNQQHFNNYSQNNTGLPGPVSSEFQSSTSQFGGKHGRNVSVWSNNIETNINGSVTIPFRPPQPLNQMPVNDNKNHFNLNRDSNAPPRDNTWNLIQKTNVPDSNIFQNPSALFNMTGNNYELLNPRVNDEANNNFQDYNMTNRFPTNQADVIPINQGEKFNSLYQNNNASFNNDSVTSYNKLSNKHHMYFQQSNDFNKKHVKRFHKNKMQDNGMPNNNFKSMKPNYSEGHNLLSHQNNNQNLIDVRVVPNKDTFQGNLPNHKFFNSNNYCRSNSGSTVVEEFTISDSESVESISSKNSPPKHFRNIRLFQTLQKVNSEYGENKFESKLVWMTESIQKALQKRNMLFKQAKTTNDPAVWDEYNKLKNEINEDIRLAKLDSNTNKSKRNTVRPKVWQDKGKHLPFNCDICDRGFSSNDELGSHQALHIKCHHLGCNFEAHPKVVALHQRMQHDTGYADVINKLQNDEEIKKWREERKRRFPTAENILKKKAEQAEKEARGEVIEEKDYGRFKKRKFEDRNKDNFTKRRDRNNRKRKHKNAFQKAPEIDLAQDSDSEGESECQTKLPKFRGMKNGLEYLLANNDVKVESTVDVKIEEADYKASIQASEVSLSQITLSSDQQDMKELDDDDTPLEIPIQKASLNESSDSADENDNKPFVSENQQELLDEAVVEVSSSARPNVDEKSSIKEKSSLSSKDDRGNRRERIEKRCRPPVPPRPKHSLLKMLLSDEIRHERNVIMQCVRHVVRNNFFGIEANT